MSYSDILTIETGKRGGKPCIRGLRITVYDVLECLASGMIHAEVLQEFPYLTEEDIRASLAFAADRKRSGEPSVGTSAQPEPRASSLSRAIDCYTLRGKVNGDAWRHHQGP